MHNVRSYQLALIGVLSLTIGSIALWSAPASAMWPVHDILNGALIRAGNSIVQKETDRLSTYADHQLSRITTDWTGPVGSIAADGVSSAQGALQTMVDRQVQHLNDRALRISGLNKTNNSLAGSLAAQQTTNTLLTEQIAQGAETQQVLLEFIKDLDRDAQETPSRFAPAKGL